MFSATKVLKEGFLGFGCRTYDHRSRTSILANCVSGLIIRVASWQLCKLYNLPYQQIVDRVSAYTVTNVIYIKYIRGFTLVT